MLRNRAAASTRDDDNSAEEYHMEQPLKVLLDPKGLSTVEGRNSAIRGRGQFHSRVHIACMMACTGGMVTEAKAVSIQSGPHEVQRKMRANG